MNFWKPNTIPYSWCEKNVTKKWYGNDNLQSLLSNPEAAKWKNIQIEYKLNSHGFRTYELDSLLGKSIDVALGCSFTKGIGIPENTRWSSIVENVRPYPMLNLGIGGGSTDTVARILTNISGLYNIQAVFILWPLAERFELYNQLGVDWIIPTSAKTQHMWNMEDDQAINRLQKNQNIVYMLKDMHKFQLVEMQLRDMLTSVPTDTARDGLHFGITANQILFDKFISCLTK